MQNKNRYIKNESNFEIYDYDNLTEEEAEEVLLDIKAMIEENPDEAEEILLDELGLEMDYIFDILDI